MDFATITLLAGIALVDSTSIGTLVVPLWLLLDPRRGAGNILLYLATVCSFYFLVGIALLYGGRALFEAAGAGLIAAVHTTPGALLVIAAGVALIGTGVWAEPKRRLRAQLDRGGVPKPDWGERVAARTPTAGATVRLAVAAAGLEIATMLPYLAAIGILASADLAESVRAALLGGYVLIMATPALFLFALRQLLGTRMSRLLGDLRDGLVRNSAAILPVLLYVIGGYVALTGVSLLPFLD